MMTGSVGKVLLLADVFVYMQVMVEFQRPAIEVMVVNVSCLTLSQCNHGVVHKYWVQIQRQVSFMNQKATPLTDFNSIPIVPEYVDVEATGLFLLSPEYALARLCVCLESDWVCELIMHLHSLLSRERLSVWTYYALALPLCGRIRIQLLARQ